MICTKTNELLTAYIMDELPSADRQRVMDHLAQCEACQQQYQRLVNVSTNLQQWQNSIELPPQLIQRWHQALQEQIAADARPVSKGWWQKKALALCAVLALVVMTTSLGLKNNYPSMVDKQPSNAPAPTVADKSLKAAESGAGQASAPLQDEAVPPTSQRALTPSGIKTDIKSKDDGKQPHSETNLAGGDSAPVKQTEVHPPAVLRASESQPNLVIAPELVVEVKISYHKGNKARVARDQQALLIQGLNEAYPGQPAQVMTDLPLSHLIDIKLVDGEQHTFHYSVQTNQGYSETLFGDQLMIPGSSWLPALKATNPLLTN